MSVHIDNGILLLLLLLLLTFGSLCITLNSEALSLLKYYAVLTSKSLPVDRALYQNHHKNSRATYYEMFSHQFRLFLIRNYTELHFLINVQH